LLNPELLDSFYREQHLNDESEALLIYMQAEIDLDSEISIFEIEETEDYLDFKKDGVSYVQLFPLSHTIDLVEFDLDLKGKGFSDDYIAKRLIDYRLNDA